MRSEKLCWQLSQRKSTLLHIATGYFHFWMHLKVVKLALFIDTITLTFVNQVFEHVYIRPRVDQKVLDFFVNLFFIVKRSVLQWRNSLDDGPSIYYERLHYFPVTLIAQIKLGKQYLRVFSKIPSKYLMWEPGKCLWSCTTWIFKNFWLVFQQ